MPLTLVKAPRTVDIPIWRTENCAAEWLGSICHVFAWAKAEAERAMAAVMTSSNRDIIVVSLIDFLQPWNSVTNGIVSNISSSYSTQSAMKILVSCGALPLRFDAHTNLLPSDVNMGKESKSG